ncbi:MAG: hypothetical protein JJ895_09205 [Balneolaceae bacterium]|nr:hypothetical protein [Balneolaceae bacterium]
MRAIALLFFSLYSCVVLAQDSNFTGKIVYEYTFINPETGVDVSDMMAEQYGREQHYFINEHSYKSYDENGTFKQLYNSANNLYYFVLGDQVMKMEASNATANEITITQFDETETILGYECKKLIVKTESSETEYWYAPKLSVNQTVFSKHKFGEWSNYLEATNGALPLKYIIKKGDFVWTTFATSIEIMSFKDDDFDIENELESN